jgi:DNA-directed RNA polymerase specialized sigma subunit
MIRNESEYEAAKRRLEQNRDVEQSQRSELMKAGLSADQIERGLEPLLTFHAELQDEIAWYDSVRRGEIPSISSLSAIGRLLIALRLAAGLSQHELAARLEVSEAAVSRDERNEYHGITVDRAQRIIDTLKGTVIVTTQPSQVPSQELLLV